jgi:hypothetical protein
VTIADREAPATGAPAYRVVLRGVPVDHFLQLHDHLDALIDELSGEAGDRHPQLAALVAGLTGPYAAGRRSTLTAAEQARAQGSATFTLELDVPLHAPEAVPVWNRLLDGADCAGSRGLLRTHPAPPDVVDLRRWIGSEVARAAPADTPN